MVAQFLATGRRFGDGVVQAGVLCVSCLRSGDRQGTRYALLSDTLPALWCSYGTKV